jgi:AcrR family transcriptional regulator
VSHNGRVTAVEPADPAAPTGGRAGRPRSEAVSQAIIDAALDLVAEHGSVAAISMDAIAARSGTSKATIYRRWSSKEELVAAAVDSLKSKPDLDLPHESVRDDLLRLGRSVPRALSEKDKAILRVIMFESGSNPEFRKHQERTMARRREAGRALFRYWVDRGALRADLDVPLAAAMFINTVLMIMVYDHYPDLKDPDVVERIVDQLLRGIEA